MTTTAAARDRWVVCASYAAGPFTEAQAARALSLSDRTAAAAGGDVRLCQLPHHIVTAAAKPEPSAPPLAVLYGAWAAPWLADPCDEAANAYRTWQTRVLAAAILACKPGDQAGPLQVNTAGWSKETADAADAAGQPGSPEWFAALGRHEHATLTGDGRGARRDAGCSCKPAAAGDWVPYEYWTAEGRAGHGYVCPDCRLLVQTG